MRPRMQGGVALNIVPNLCEVDFEIRNLAQDDPQKILAGIRDRAEEIVARVRDHAPEASIEISENFSYPGLDTPGTAEVVGFVKSLTGGNATCKVAFGTEGGLFSQELSIPTVVLWAGVDDAGAQAR